MHKLLYMSLHPPTSTTCKMSRYQLLEQDTANSTIVYINNGLQHGLQESCVANLAEHPASCTQSTLPATALPQDCEAATELGVVLLLGGTCCTCWRALAQLQSLLWIQQVPAHAGSSSQQAWTTSATTPAKRLDQDTLHHSQACNKKAPCWAPPPTPAGSAAPAAPCNSHPQPPFSVCVEQAVALTGSLPPRCGRRRTPLGPWTGPPRSQRCSCASCTGQPASQSPGSHAPTR